MYEKYNTVWLNMLKLPYAEYIFEKYYKGL